MGEMRGWKGGGKGRGGVGEMKGMKGGGEHRTGRGDGIIFRYGESSGGEGKIDLWGGDGVILGRGER